MGLKKILKEKQILASAIDMELKLPGEPMIYSIKYQIGQRTRGVQFFRNMKWASLLKCCFRAQHNTTVPVVLLVRFYVSPPSHITVSKADLAKETVPAVRSHEICEYVLSFQEMLLHVLMNSYRQVVHMEASKFYSSNPRTVFKFMRWSEYEKLSNNNPLHPQGKSIRKSKQKVPLQPKRQGDASNEKVPKRSASRRKAADTTGGDTSSSPLSDPCAPGPITTEEEKKTPAAPC